MRKRCRLVRAERLRLGLTRRTARVAQRLCALPIENGRKPVIYKPHAVPNEHACGLFFACLFDFLPQKCYPKCKHFKKTNWAKKKQPVLQQTACGRGGAVRKERRRRRRDGIAIAAQSADRVRRSRGVSRRCVPESKEKAARFATDCLWQGRRDYPERLKLHKNRQKSPKNA